MDVWRLGSANVVHCHHLLNSIRLGWAQLQSKLQHVPPMAWEIQGFQCSPDVFPSGTSTSSTSPSYSYLRVLRSSPLFVNCPSISKVIKLLIKSIKLFEYELHAGSSQDAACRKRGLPAPCQGHNRRLGNLKSAICSQSDTAGGLITLFSRRSGPEYRRDGIPYVRLINRRPPCSSPVSPRDRSGNDRKTRSAD